VWTREAFGILGFLSAWMYWMSNLPYFPSVLYFGAGSLLFAAGARGMGFAASPVYFMNVSVVWLAIITVVNIVGLDAEVAEQRVLDGAGGCRSDSGALAAVSPSGWC